MNRLVTSLSFAGISALCFVSEAASATPDAFAAGQSWVCTTDQRALAFLKVHGVDGKSVLFDYGIRNAVTHRVDPLCNQRAPISILEIKQFCEFIGGALSEGHVRLQYSCQATR